MKPRTLLAPCLLLALALSPSHASDSAALLEETATFGRFGTVHLYRPAAAPSRVAVFVSGDGGWNLGVVEMARAFAHLDSLVIGVDVTHYMHEAGAGAEKCTYAAADFEALGQYVQHKLGFPTFTPPVLVGYSSGATLVYATLAQAPVGTFAGGISLGFCPDLPLERPLCRGEGLEWKPGPKGKGVSFLPAPKLRTRWIAFQGEIDQVCDPREVASYVGQIPSAELVALPGVGHGFSVQAHWLPQLERAYKSLDADATPVTARIEGSGAGEPPDDLPIVEVPAAASASSTRLAVIVSGDGGWAGLDRELGSAFAERGIPVAGLNSLKYFWTRRTPDVAASDLARILRHYLPAWGRERVILVGYSLGADVLPFMITRLPADLRQRVDLVVLLGPSSHAEFQFHLSNWIGGRISDEALPTRPEIDRLAGTSMICACGEDDEECICKELPSSLAQVMLLKGGHHFGGEYEGLATRIVAALGG
jgi:type IV secretory pathway VirJ component